MDVVLDESDFTTCLSIGMMKDSDKQLLAIIKAKNTRKMTSEDAFIFWLEFFIVIFLVFLALTTCHHQG